MLKALPGGQIGCHDAVVGAWYGTVDFMSLNGSGYLIRGR